MNFIDMAQIDNRKPSTLWIAILMVFPLSLGLLRPMPLAAQETLETQGIRFRLIPGGEYLLGSAPDEPGRYADEAQPHKVSLAPFYLSVTEITNAQYGRFLKATGAKSPLYWGDKNLNAPNQPVVGVTWFDAAAFCRWLTRATGVTCQLPTEAQWEAAARGGLVGRPYPWGAADPDAGGGWRANLRHDRTAKDGFLFSAPVGSFPANGYDLFDMAGNVAEWCRDRYVPLRAGGPFKPGDLRLLKGGSWISGPRDLRVAARQSGPPHYADGYIGFRVVCLSPP